MKTVERNTMRALEIGPGKYPVDKTWDTMDMIQRANLTYLHDVRVRPWPVPTGRYDLVYMSHILEHVPWFNVVDVLREALRVLKQEGTIEVWVPNFEKIVEAYLKQRPGDPWRKFNPRNDYMTWVNGRIFTYGPGDENWHRTVFDGRYLKQCLRDAGFRHTVRLQKPRGYDHGPINLGIAAVK